MIQKKMDGRNSMQQILIVEDDRSIAEGIQDILQTAGYVGLIAKDADEAREMLKKEKVDMVLLDVHLGKESGYDLCKSMRKTMDIPIVFLTACNSEMELIRGFQAGGDDYVTKPFRVQELLLRIQAVLRRTGKKSDQMIQTGELVCDRSSCQIRKNGKTLDMTLTEWRLADALISHAPDTLTREELLYLVWDKDALFVEGNTLNVNISRLREKLGICENKEYIETIRGTGYRWAVPVRK